MDTAAPSQQGSVARDLARVAGKPLTIRRVRLGSLELDPDNPRTHGERSIEGIKASLRRWGQVDPVLVNRRNHRVIGGNGRVVAMRELGWEECDTVELDLTEMQAIALSTTLNRTGDLSEFSMPALGKILASLKADGQLDGVGFDQAEIDTIVAGLLDRDPGEIVDDEVPEPPDKATSRRGDLWRIGRHRVLNGDSSSEADLDRLLAGAPIHLVHMDPPYNTKTEPRSNNAIAAGISSFSGVKHHQKLDLARHPEKAKRTTRKMRPKDRPLQNDFLPDAEFAALLRKWFANAARALLPGRAFYVWGGYANVANYPSALAEAELYFSQAIIWVKEHPVLTRKDFMGNHEWCFYGWREGAAHVFLGPNNAPDVWSVKKLNHTQTSHLTEKPQELPARAMHYSSRPGENVLDLMGGSGSTGAAAEQTGRNAFLLELDSPYTDVIVTRLQKLTGKDAILDGTSKTFAQVAAERGGS